MTDEAGKPKCQADRPELEIEVTEEMLRAGAREVGNWASGEDNPAWIAEAIYREMEKARRGIDHAPPQTKTRE